MTHLDIVQMKRKKNTFNWSFYWAVLKATFLLTSCSERWFAYQACLQLSAGRLCHGGPVRMMCISLLEGSSTAAKALTRNIIIISSRILSTATAVPHCESSGESSFWNNPPVCYPASQTITSRKVFFSFLFLLSTTHTDNGVKALQQRDDVDIGKSEFPWPVLSYLLTVPQREPGFGCGCWPANQGAVSRVLKGYLPSLLQRSMESQEKPSVLRSISGPGSNDEQPPDSTGRLPGTFIAADTHFDIKKERRPRLFHSQLFCAEPVLPPLGFSFPISFCLSLSTAPHPQPDQWAAFKPLSSNLVLD